MENINENIHINQIGYRPTDRKLAFINGKCGKFNLIEEESGRSVLEDEIKGGDFDELSGDIVFYADFTRVENPGRYYISIPDIGRSYSFNIEEHVYRDIKNAMIKAMYYQRCGVKLHEEHAGLWKHEACHLQDGRIYESNDIIFDGTGGWHDAGDYGKYTVAGAYAVAYLLIAYELFPFAYNESINIPESGNSIPDILNEARFELNWLYKMQDFGTGGVYSKFTSKTFPDNLEKDSKGVMPEKDLLDLFAFPITSTATADFAAVMALASRIFGNFDREFSDKCLRSAEKAWDWLLVNRELVCQRNPPGVVTGEYWDDSDKDERYWAAAELYKTTHKNEYQSYLIKAFKTGEITEGMWWRNVGGLGSIAYLFAAPEIVDLKIYHEIKKSFLQHADKLADNSKQNGYGISLDGSNYIWGSNLLVMNAAFYLIIANMIKPDERYVNAAKCHIDYLFGCNALNQCYITGFGSKPVKNPHHRPSVADGVEEAVPGLVSGGPNTGLQDEYSKKLKGNPPARCFIDNDQSYATNEIAIYWNTPAVFVAGFFDIE